MDYWQQMARVSAHAIKTGHQLPLATRTIGVEDCQARMVIPGREKPRGQAQQHPFLDIEPELFVAEVSSEHNLLLNKFNVFDHHGLITTRSFKPQQALLSASDLAVAHHFAYHHNALVFYNGGGEAGASQSHRHLQILPLQQAPWHKELASPLVWPFRHLHHLGVMSLDELISFQLLAAREFDIPLCPYNFLLAKHFALVIPRKQERVEDMSINALGFAGSFLVKSEAQLNLLQTKGALNLLMQVAFERQD